MPDGWKLSGSKTFITNGPVAQLALVYAKTGPVDGRDIGLFMVEMDSPGASAGEKMHKMGWRGSETGELFFDEVVVPAENVLGGADNGLRVLMSGLNSERVLMAAEAVGLAQGAFDAALAYAKERTQFGRRIGEFQLIRAKLADMYAEIAAVRALVEQTIDDAEAGGVGDLRLTASAAKVLSADLVMRVTTEAVQILGGYGYVREYPVERYIRDAKLFQIGGGTSEVLRDLIGRQLVG
jgi:isovaleryl-CoA dehydrogenase